MSGKAAEKPAKLRRLWIFSERFPGEKITERCALLGFKSLSRRIFLFSGLPSSSICHYSMEQIRIRSHKWGCCKLHFQSSAEVSHSGIFHGIIRG